MTGEAVNLAARLAARASPGEILASGSVRDATTSAVAFASGGALDLKGIAEPVPAWRALGRLAAKEERPRPLVGRAAELGN